MAALEKVGLVARWSSALGQGQEMQTVSDRMVQLIASVEPEGDLDAKLARLVKGELLRRLARYELSDKHLARKYGMSFEEFKRNRVVVREGYSYEVESDFWDWEMALDGVQTTRELLETLKAP